MAESEGEIEYLEEDAEIVQQCVQSVQFNSKPVATPPTPKSAGKSLLVERPPAQKRKKKQDDDSEYDPSEDNMPPSPPSPPPRKKRFMRPLRKSKADDSVAPSSAPIIPQTKIKKVVESDIDYRRKFNIRIPDYDDPLCLPVRAIKTEASDKKRLDNWNSVCLEHFKHCDSLLKPERGYTTKSVRTAIFRNVVNKQTGSGETTIWSKTCVENEDGDKKSEIFQCVLPRYKEKRMLGNYLLGQSKNRSSVRTVNEIILSKENHTDGEALVVYRPKESLSAVYGLIDKRKSAAADAPTEGAGGAGGAAARVDGAVFLRELTANRLCVPCYQASWRARAKQPKSVSCPACARTFVSVYNLLAHVRGHQPSLAPARRAALARLLAQIVPYHYRCRACRRQFDSIRDLRAHLAVHLGKEKFTCEVCTREVNA